MSERKRILVIGGGITGLSAAHRVTELARERGLDVEVRVLDANPRPGGIIGTVRRDGLVLECGPDSMITDKPWGIGMARRVGLEGELVGTQNQNRRSFVVRNGKLMPVPEGFQLLAPAKFGPLASTSIFSWPGKLRMGLDLLIPRRQSEADESLGAFVLRRLGREALERMAQPMIAGIYGADPMELSLQATLPRFRDMEREHGSVIRGMWARSRSTAPNGSANPQPPTPNSQAGVSGARYGLFVSFRNGMQSLPDAVAAALPTDCVQTGSPAASLRRDGDQWIATTRDGREWSADGVIVALPAFAAGELLHALDRDLARLLCEIPYAGAATVALIYPREDVPHPLDGFGFVVPKAEGLSILGCTFTQQKWPNRAPEGTAVLRAFLGNREATSLDHAGLVETTRRDLSRLLGMTKPPADVQVSAGKRWMPQYRVGHLERVEEMERRAALLPALALAGNAYRGVGIPDSVRSGEAAAEHVLQTLSV